MIICLSGGRLPPHSTALPAFIDIRKIVIALAIIVANSDRKGIAKRPLHLPAVDTNSDIGMRVGVNQLDGESIDASCMSAIPLSKH